MPKLTLTNIGSLQNETTAITQMNANSALISAAVENTLSRDGTSPNQMSSNFDMNSNRIYNLPTPLTPAEPLRLADLTSFVGGGPVVALPAGGTTDQILTKNTAVDYDVAWKTKSVGLALPSDFTVTNSPVTGSGTLTGAWAVAPTGTGAVVRQSSPTINTPTITNQQVDSIRYNGTSSGTTSLVGPATGVSGVLTLPSASDTLVSRNSVDTLTLKTLTFPSLANPVVTGASPNASGQLGYSAPALNFFDGGSIRTVATLDSTQTLTNKTFDTAGAGNSFQIASFGVNATTGSTSTLVRQTSPTLITPILGVATATSINGATVSPGHHSGEPSTGSAVAGEIGELIKSDIALGSAVSLTTNTAQNMTSISLTAGDWDVYFNATFNPAGTTSLTRIEANISQTTGTRDTTTLGADYNLNFAAFVPNGSMNALAGPLRISLASTTTIYAVALASFTVSTCTVFGQLRARRMR